MAYPDWQPIETHPREEDVEFLTWDGDFCVVAKVGWYDDGIPVLVDGDYVRVNPTHWMPLPPPPEDL